MSASFSAEETNSEEFTPEPINGEVSVSKDACYEIVLPILKQITESLTYAVKLLEVKEKMNPKIITELITSKRALAQIFREESGMRVVKGIFDGSDMVASNGRVFSVPANYASKSKLVEGDVLKLTIGSDGSFIYKQIGPVQRERLVGTVASDSSSDCLVVTDKRQAWKILPASVSFFKLRPGQTVSILIPKGARSTWAAIENVLKN